ncbi:MAG TPA: hypothetical protein VMY16_16290 [Ilumatobacteraceae bacterium]|nr:hypothetical protein [Ilumatobacteraceae bacterium]
MVDLVSLDTDGAVQQLPDTVTPAISDTGVVVAYDAVVPVVDGTESAGMPPARRVWIRDRVGGTSRPVAETNSAAPGISGNGCVVAYSVLRDANIVLAVVDRCATSIEAPLPLGAMVDSVAVDTEAVAPTGLGTPALSFDGSTIVWSTGREIRRYVRPAAGGAHQQTQIFDVVGDGDPAIVTGADLDVSADGATTVFVAGPGVVPYEPARANVYMWSAATPDLEPELVSATSSGEAGLADSTSPTISGDGAFIAFESIEPDLAVVGSTPVILPVVVGVDLTASTARVLVDDATRPAVSADGNHVVYQRGDAVRLLTSGATTDDVAIAELTAAGPTSRLSISEFGRWIVFASRSDLSGGDLVGPVAMDALAVWAADRRSSADDVVDTTTSTTSTTTTTTTTTTPASSTTTLPSTTSTTSTDPGSTSLPTVPVSTVVPSVVPRFPTSGRPFRTVVFPVAPRRTVVSASAPRPFDAGAGFDVKAVASSVVFEPTVVAAGRRTAPVTMTNPTASAVGISSTSVEGADAFTIVSDGCSGVVVAAGGSCVVEVRFAPTTLGRSVGSATFRLLDGSLVTATLEGEGVAAPTLDLVPAVAGAGQTVTVFGAGFVAGSTVELNQPGVAVSEPVVVDADGTFAHVIVVLPNTPTGPASLMINGQPDVFDDVIAQLLVSSRGSTSADTALRSGPVRAGGR